MSIQIRVEQPDDYRVVEEMTREAFRNLHVPGCDEHHLVRRMRSHKDFIPELALVAVDGAEIVGSIFYTHSFLYSRDFVKLDTLTFGPLCVRKSRQRQGIGRLLVEASLAMAAERGGSAVVIEGFPKDYCRYGFRGCDTFEVADVDDDYPFGLLVRELVPGILRGRSWRFQHSPLYDEVIDPAEFDAYDATFPRREKRFESSQEEFRIACASVVRRSDD